MTQQVSDILAAIDDLHPIDRERLEGAIAERDLLTLPFDCEEVHA